MQERLEQAEGCNWEAVPNVYLKAASGSDAANVVPADSDS